MDRVSDEQLESCIRWTDGIELSFVELQFIHSALTELRERRAAEKAPCPEHAKMVREETQVKFSWHCPQCFNLNIFEWSLDDWAYFDFYCDELECDQCGKCTKIGKRPQAA